MTDRTDHDGAAAAVLLLGPAPDGLTGVPHRHLPGVAAAQAALDGPHPAEAVVVTLPAPQAVRAVQGVHALHPDVAVILSGELEGRAATLAALRFAPGVGPDVTWVAPPELPGAVPLARHRTRVRRQHAQVVHRVNAALRFQAVVAPQHLLDQLLDVLPLGVLTLDGRGQILRWNAAAAALLGPLSLNGPAAGVLPELAAQIGDVAGGVHRLERGDRHGPRQVLSVHLSRLGEAPGTLVILEDITRQVQAEEERDRAYAELQAMNGTLEARVRERTQALEAQALALQQSNAELERFAYVASHDLQEPLRTITSFTDLLVHRAGPALDPAVGPYLKHIRDGAQRMKTLIDDLLAYSRLGAARPTPRAVDAAEPLQEALRRLEGAVRGAGAQVTAGPMPIVLADAPQLTQVFQNLIGNAVKFQPPGRVPVVHVTARPEPDGAGWRIEVRDNGIGIEPAYQERIFTMFQRLNLREEYPGNGLGLAVCRKIVESFGGQLGVHSQAGQGSTFWLTLPAAP